MFLPVGLRVPCLLGAPQSSVFSNVLGLDRCRLLLFPMFPGLDRLSLQWFPVFLRVLRMLRVLCMLRMQCMLCVLRMLCVLHIVKNPVKTWFCGLGYVSVNKKRIKQCNIRILN